MHFLREHHAGKSEIISAVQADYAVNLNTRGTPVRLPGWLFYASALLFLTAFAPEQRPQNADAAKRKEPQEEGLWPLLLRFLSFEITPP